MAARPALRHNAAIAPRTHKDVPRMYRTLLKASLTLLFKLALLWLALPLIAVDLILLQVGMPRRAGFEWPPFLYAALLALALSAVGAWRKRDPELPVVTALAILAAGIAFLHGNALSPQKLAWLFGAAVVPAALNFLYRNRITEPMLALLPVLLMAFLFVELLYRGAFILWAYAITDLSLADAPMRHLEAALGSSLNFALMLPFSLMYLLGKHSYAPLLRKAMAAIRR
ncbi:hypothetical protein D3C78_905160 [compost metagenome]